MNTNTSRTETFQVKAPLFCPYYNIWGRVEYWRTDAFVHNPFTLPASSTSGSPIILDAEGRFFGFLTDKVTEGAIFEFDGKERLKISVPEGQQLFVEESGNPDAWKIYNSKVLQSLPESGRQERFWSDIEYCTWVEQKALAAKGQTPHDVLNHAFIENYIQEINRLGYPKGKLTIDHGWQHGDDTYGDWDAHPERFPDLQRTADLIRENGFTPGLWMAPVWLHPQARIFKEKPEWVGDPIAPSTPDSPNHKPKWHYFKYEDAIEEHFTNVFSRFHRMGFRKLKFDMMYHNKEYMKALHRIFYRAVKNAGEEIEVEIHQPDIFFTPYCDAVRTNDVLCNEQYPWWRQLTQAHNEVCEKCAPGKVINLDHIGGNDPKITGETFLKHLSLYENATGYPAVSVLPRRYGEEAVEKLGAYLSQYNQSRNTVSTYRI